LVESKAGGRQYHSHTTRAWVRIAQHQYKTKESRSSYSENHKRSSLRKLRRYESTRRTRRSCRFMLPFDCLRKCYHLQTQRSICKVALSSTIQLSTEAPRMTPAEQSSPTRDSDVAFKAACHRATAVGVFPGRDAGLLGKSLEAISGYNLGRSHGCVAKRRRRTLLLLSGVVSWSRLNPTA